ncbi:hypothetical protein PspLS_09126 [Pyricularia sp. CBS 133598]|nr:hypothetical protein PspLS_09126 [Pyricularia sp. CBS 133598]
MFTGTYPHVSGHRSLENLIKPWVLFMPLLIAARRAVQQADRLMAGVDELGLWEDMVTMLFTDHGEYLGDHCLIEKWPSGLSESLVREPLIVGGAGLPESKTVSAITEMVDLVPIMLGFSGIGEHFPHNGRSWVPVLVGDETAQKKLGLVGKAISLRDEEWTYVYRLYEPPELYDRRLGRDPYEMHNLAAEPEHKAQVAAYEKEIITEVAGCWF